MTDTDHQASRRVVANPLSNDPNAGIIVAAGDTTPAAVGLIENTPNKVDAAANYDDVDAADKAGAGARPATTIVAGGDGPDQAIVDRVAENRNVWEQESQMLSTSSPQSDSSDDSNDSDGASRPARRSGSSSKTSQARKSGSSSKTSRGGA